MAPDGFHGVELGRVRGQPLHVEATATKAESTDRLTLVHPEAVPNQDHGSPEVATEIPEEVHDSRGPFFWIEGPGERGGHRDPAG